MWKAALLGTTAFFAAAPALAQDQTATDQPDPNSQSTVGEVVVTGSRIALAGYEAPTPVTVVGVEQLQRDNFLDVPNVLAKLPAVRIDSMATNGGSVSISTGNVGTATANLRNLGTNRTLILFDGVRAAPATVEGNTDIDMIPTSLLQRIDVVTAGASAAWGSNAVAGVINVILNKKFDGLQFNITGSTNQDAGVRRANAEVSWGRDVLGGRGHVILSGSYLYSPDVYNTDEAPWFHSQWLVNNPAATPTNSQPNLILANNVGLAIYTQGGLVTSGPLKGLYFGQGGQPQTFNFGTVSGGVTTGGTYAPGYLNGISSPLNNPLNNGNLFGFFRYSLAENIEASLQLNYTDVKAVANTTPYTRQNNLTINIDNPYLPSSVVAQMQTAGVTSFLLSTTNSNNVIGSAHEDWREPNELGVNWQKLDRSMFRQVADINATFGDWAWKADVQHSRIERDSQLHTVILNNYNLASDPVRVTAANVGSSGLVVGSVACRSTLTSPNNGCVPLNVLGVGVASQDAINYVTGGKPAYSTLVMEQYSADLSVQGKLFHLPAGQVAIAAGLDWRRDSLDQESDTLANNLGYAVGNFPSYKAHEGVWEGFTEADIPVVKDVKLGDVSVLKALTLNGAARYTDYAISGSSLTWKAGLTADITDSFRFRGTLSKDIRAPSLSDLFTPPTNNLQVVADPARNNALTNIYFVSKGNPNLKPEIGHTETVGFVYRPKFIPGFDVSLDWYHIKITDALASPGFQLILDQCTAGNQTYCALIGRDSNGVLQTIALNTLNLASQETEGFDLQVDYNHKFGPGRVIVNTTGNWIDYLKQSQFGTTTNNVGSLGSGPTLAGGQPHLRWNSEFTYKLDRWSGTVGVNYVGSGKYDKLYTAKNIYNNDIPSFVTYDLRASYYLGKDQHYQLYGAIDNLLNKAPLIIAALPTGSNPGFFPPTRTDLYPTLGRVFRIGLRGNF